MRRFLGAAAAAWACLTALGPVATAQPQADPFRGQYASIEITLAPRAAERQAAALDEALDALQPQRRGVTDVYVLAAGFWSDPVFESEASQAADILRQRLGADGRTIVLSQGGGVGDPRFPAATPFNVSAAMGRIGRLIDPEEDLVVIFFTSHGSPDGSIAIRDQSRLSAALRPVHLRDALNDAGIRNRVVIVSACFSGAFVAPLIDERTIVLTAAAPDRSSFGCQPENEWTYFGDAYFNNALRNGAPLVQAFDEARTQIAQWERERGIAPPSNPQRHVGARAHDLVRRAETAARAR
ncbi:MAG: C13 family peptidase [Hyphomonadaceae bacterium]|nr:C13 family peptidase [Hyphomonadaceae bacterium]